MVSRIGEFAASETKVAAQKTAELSGAPQLQQVLEDAQKPKVQTMNEAAGSGLNLKSELGQTQAKQEEKDKEKEDAALSKEDVEEMSSALNEFMSKLQFNLKFEYHDELDRMTMKMLDKKTGEIIKEFPPEEVIKTLEATKEWIGVFLDKNA